MIYFVLFYLLLLFSVPSWKSQKISKVMYHLLFSFFVILICMRRMDVGTDTTVYHGFFSGLGGYYGTIDNPTERMEPGLSIIGRVLRLFFFGSNNSYIYMILLCGVTLWVLYKGLSKYAVNPLLSLFLILTVVRGALIIMYIAALRQCLGMSLILLGAYILIEKKGHYNRNFIILSFSAFLIHRTSLLVAILLWFIDKFELKKKSAYIIIGASAILSVFISTLFSDVLYSALMFLDSNMGFDKYSYYLESESFDSANRGLLSAGVNIVIPLICVYCTPKYQINNLFLKSLIFGTSIFLLFGSFEQGSRMVAPFLVLGFMGALPYSLSLNEQVHNIMSKNNENAYTKLSNGIRVTMILTTIVLGFFLISRAYIAYFIEETVDILPYHFLWE